MAAARRGLVVATIALGALLLGACAEGNSSREAHPSTLAGGAWRAVEINDRPTVAGNEPTLRFQGDHATGETGCNFYDGDYSYDPSTGQIAINQTAMSAVGCEPALGEIEAAYVDALAKVSSASIDPEGHLILSGGGVELLFGVDAIPAATPGR
jgi:heat shock protein HslJ